MYVVMDYTTIDFSELEVGGEYLDRQNSVIKIVSSDRQHPPYSFKDSTGSRYMADGRYLCTGASCEFDLIKKIVRGAEEPATTKAPETTLTYHRPSWREYYLNIAKEVAKRSHDGQTKVGAVLVNKNNHIIGTGYNGFPPGLDDSSLPRLRPNKYPYMIHAEMNAIVHAEGEVSGGELFVTHSPCLECMKLIVAAKIKDVYFLEQYESENKDLIASIAALCGVGLYKI